MNRADMLVWCKANNVDFANQTPIDLPDGWMWAPSVKTFVLIGQSRRKGVNFELIEPSDLGQGTK